MGSLRDWLTEPEHSSKVHLVFLWTWLIPGSVVTILWLSNSVAFVAWMSLYAIVIGHWSSWQASRAEKRIKDDSDDT